MKLLSYDDVRAFHRDAAEPLARREVANNLPLGILNRGAESGAGDDWFMARAAFGTGESALIALMTPPYNLLLACPGEGAPEEALRLLASHLLAGGIEPPGVLAEAELSRRFAELYAEQSGKVHEVSLSERLYRLDRVEDVPVSGALRPAARKDMHYLPYWMKAFTDECFHVDSPLDAAGVESSIGREALFVLEDGGQPVSMAGSSRQMPGGRSVGPVYTPPYLRGRGYATSCVALISRQILERGNGYCALFTDLLNPVSNGIYQKIGYRPVSDYLEIRFR